MAISTTQSIWRSGGGDNTRTAYAGTGVMAAQANCAATGGTTPTFDMGFTIYGTSTASNTALISAAVATTGKLVINQASATAGTSMGAAMNTTNMVTITGGGTSGDAPTGGSITGTILYYVTDPAFGQENV